MKLDKELVGLAEELIKRKASKFDPKAFKDTYEDALREMIDAKIENRPPEAIEEPQLGAKVINLMDALKRSVGGRRRRRAAGSGAHRDQGGGGQGGARRRSRRRRARPKRKAKAPAKAGKGRRAA